MKIYDKIRSFICKAFKKRKLIASYPPLNTFGYMDTQQDFYEDEQ